MHSIRVGALRPVARVGGIASSLAIIAMLLLPNAAFAATTIGFAAGNNTCVANLDTVQLSSSTSYTVPLGGGVITEWSTQAGVDLGQTLPQAGLQVWRLITAPTTYQLVGASPLEALAPTVLNTFTLVTPIPVQAGDLIGLRVELPITCFQSGAPGDSFGYVKGGANPALLSIETMTVYPVDALLNVSATVGAAIPPPPPPPPGCDQTGDQNGDQTGDQTGHMPGHSHGDHTDVSKADRSGDKSGDNNDKNTCDQGNASD